MPWCPKCEVEYREGFTTCSDCKSELVEDIPKEIEYVPFIQAENEATAKRLVDYFIYSKVEATIAFDEEKRSYIVSVPSAQQKAAQKHYKAFVIVEQDLQEEKVNTLDSASHSDSEANEEDEENEDDRSEDIPMNVSKPYVMKGDKYKDLRSTANLFFLFGIGGLIFVVLNYLEVFTIVNNLFQYIIFTALFIGFIIVAISTNGSAKKIKSEIAIENKLTEDINAWLAENITMDYYKSVYNDDISLEVNYITIIDQIKEMVIQQFGNHNSDYLDRLVDEYYDKTF